MSDRYTLAEARAIIDAEKCRFEAASYCYVHGGLNYGAGVCDSYPEVADVAAQLLATVERVERLADELVRTNRLLVFSEDIQKAINGEGVTE